MPNDSTTTGYLQPVDGNALDDQALDRIFHDLIMNLTGLSAELIFPRWQVDPPNMPANGTNWIAQGSKSRMEDIVPWQSFDAATGIYTLNRNQQIENHLSFYGPGASGLEALLRDNIAIGQNRDVIGGLDIALVKVGDPVNLSGLTNERWNKRIDVTVTFRRLIWRTYQVLPLLSAPGTITSDTGIIDTFNAV